MIPVWATWSVRKFYALKSTAMSTDHHLAWVHPDREEKVLKRACWNMVM